MLRHCIDAGITSQLLDCDQCAIFLKLRVMRRLKKKTGPRRHILNVDHQLNSQMSFLMSKVIYQLSIILNTLVA